MNGRVRCFFDTIKSCDPNAMTTEMIRQGAYRIAKSEIMDLPDPQATIRFLVRNAPSASESAGSPGRTESGYEISTGDPTPKRQPN